MASSNHKLNLKCGTEVITETANEDAASRVSFSVDSSDDSDDNKRTLESDDGVGLTSPDVAPSTDRLDVIFVCPKCGTTITDGRSPASTLFKPVKRPGHHTRKSGLRWMKGKRLGDIRQTPYARSKSDEAPNNRVATEAHRKMHMRETVSASGGRRQKHGDGVVVMTGDNAFGDAIKSVANVGARNNCTGVENELRNGAGNVSGEAGTEGRGVTPSAAPKRRRRRRRKRGTQGEGAGLESSLNSVSVYGGNPKWSWK